MADTLLMASRIRSHLSEPTVPSLEDTQPCCLLALSICPCAILGTELGTQSQRHQGSDCPMLSTRPPPPSISKAITAALAPAKSGPCRFCRRSQGPTCSLPSLRMQGPAQKHSTRTSEQKHKDGERLPLLKDGKLLGFKNNLRRGFFFILERAPRHCQIYLGGLREASHPNSLRPSMRFRLGERLIGQGVLPAKVKGSEREPGL